MYCTNHHHDVRSSRSCGSMFGKLPFVRASASVATAEGCTGRGSISPAADTVIASVFAIPIEGGTGSAEALAAATPSAQPTYLSRSSTQETAPPRPPVRLCPSPPCLALQPLLRRRRADEQRQQRVMHPRCRLWIRAHLPDEVQPRRESTSPADPVAAATPALADSPVRTVPLPSDRDHAEPIWELLSYDTRLLLVIRRLHIQGRTPSETLLSCGLLIPSRVIHMTIGSESSTLSRRATP